MSSAQEGATPQTVTLIDRAIDVLRTTELYSPHMREDYRLKSDDPVANDLIGALLTVSEVSYYSFIIEIIVYYAVKIPAYIE